MDDVSRKNKHRPPQSRTAAGQRTLKPGATGSFTRRRLVGAVPVERLPEPTRALVEEAVELDRRLLSRGWIFEESMASPNVLAWSWPTSDIAQGDVEPYDPHYDHELVPRTVVGYYLDALEPTDLALALSSWCIWNEDEMLSAVALTGGLDEIEAHRASSAGPHRCPLAGAVMSPPPEGKTRRPDLLYLEPLSVPTSQYARRADVIAKAHGGDPARLLKFMQQLPVRVRDRTGNHIIDDPWEHDAFQVAITRGLVGWDEVEKTYACTNASDRWEAMYGLLASEVAG
jgi:hypothetical protein